VDPWKENPPAKVSDYIDHTMASRNVTNLKEFFLSMDYKIIRNIPLCDLALGAHRYLLYEVCSWSTCTDEENSGGLVR
jgi:hypothetical protein